MPPIIGLILLPVALLFVHGECMVKYKECKKYVYQVESELSFNEKSVQLEAKFGLQAIVNSKEILLEINSVYLIHGVIKEQVKETGNWFSFKIAPDGEILKVFYPNGESDDVIKVKKTLVGYLSGKLHINSSSYEVDEINIQGRHKANYKRQSNKYQTQFTKIDRDTHLGHHGHMNSSKVITVVHDHNVPSKIVIQQQSSVFAQVAKGFQITPPPSAGPNTNFTIDRRNLTDIPGIHSKSRGVANLVTVINMDCLNVTKRPNVIEDTLEMKSQSNRINYLKIDDTTSRQIKEDIVSNMTCVRLRRRKESHVHEECMQKLCRLLKIIPDKHLSHFVMMYLLESHNNNIDDRRTIIDALGKLRTKKAQRILYEGIFNRSEFHSFKLLHRTATHFLTFKTPPIPEITNSVLRIALTPSVDTLTISEKVFHRGMLIIFGNIVNILHKKGDSKQRLQAAEMLQILERKVGYHDPVHWKHKRARRSVDEYNDDLNKARNAIFALGGCKMPGVVDRIAAHLNHSDTPYTLKWASIHALRGFTEEKAAEVLLHTSLFSNDTYLRSEANDVYKEHPSRINVEHLNYEINQMFREGSLPRNDVPVEDVSLPHHLIVKRSATSPPRKFKLASPTLDWMKHIGNDKIGGTMGIKVKNEIDLDISEFNGHLSLTLDNRAFVIVNFGFVKQMLTIFDAKFCFIGRVDYDINMLRNYGFNDVREIVQFWDKYQNGLVKNNKEALEKFMVLIEGDKSFLKSVNNLERALDEFPIKVKHLGRIARDSIQLIGEMDKRAIPTYAQPLLKVFNRVINLFDSIKPDVMNFYDEQVDIIKSQLPVSWIQIQEGLYTIGQLQGKFYSSPMEAILGEHKAIEKIELGVQSIVKGKNRIFLSSFSKKDEKPYWWDLTGMLKEIDVEFERSYRVFNNGALKSKNASEVVIINILNNLFKNLTAPFNTLTRLSFPFVEALNIFTQRVLYLQNTSLNIRSVYANSRVTIERIFGPKVYFQFPSKIRSDGAGCSQPGTYPTENNGPGIDLLAQVGEQIKNPFEGEISRLSDNRVVIVRNGNSFEKMDIYITNIKPEEFIPFTPNKTKVFPGEVIGRADKSHCVNHIHFAVRMNGKSVDPTSFLSKYNIKVPRWNQKCSEFYLIFVGLTLLDGESTEAGEIIDRSPKRTTSLPTNFDIPKHSRRSGRNANNDIVTAITPNWENVTNTVSDIFGLPLKPELDKSSQSQNIRSIHLVKLVDQLEKLKLFGAKDELIELTHRIINETKVTKCLRPEQMTMAQLRANLQGRGIFVNGSYETMIEAYFEPSSKCPLWMPSLPKRSLCQFDDRCVGVECCLDLKLGIFLESVKAWIRLDSCSLDLRFGLTFRNKSWTKVIHFSNELFGIEKEKLTGIKHISFAKTYEIKIKYIVRNDNSSMSFYLHGAFCDEDNVCFPNVPIFNDLLLPLPTCNSNGSINWPKINFNTYLSSKIILNELSKIPNSLNDLNKQKTLDYFQDILQIPRNVFISQDSQRCITPFRMTATDMRDYLGFQQSTNGATLDMLRNMTSNKMRTCNQFQLADHSNFSDSSLFCGISSDCWRTNCCLNISVPGLNKTSIVGAFVHLDPCKLSLTFGALEKTHTILLLDYEWGDTLNWNLGAIQLECMIKKTPANNHFEVMFSVALCPKDQTCLYRKVILQDEKFLVPICNGNFNNCFTSVVPLTSLLKQGVKATNERSKDSVLRCFNLSDILDNEKNENTTLEGCSSNINPRILRTCEPDKSCWSLQCSLDLDVFLFKASNKVWISFNPCSYKLDVGIGLWNMTTNLMRSQNNVSQEFVSVGNGIKIEYKMNTDPSITYILMNLGFSVCYRESCTTTQFVLKDRKIDKPPCSSSYITNLPGGSVTGFIDWLGDNSTTKAGKLAVDRVLTHRGIKPCLSDSQCSLDGSGASVALDGWLNHCSSISRLPKLSSGLMCQISSDCQNFHCCYNYDVNIWSGPIGFKYKLDLCDMALTITFENCVKFITNLTLDKEDIVDFDGVKSKYLIKKVINTEQYIINIDLYICSIRCQWITILSESVMVQNCSDSKTILVRERRRASLFGGFSRMFTKLKFPKLINSIRKQYKKDPLQPFDLLQNSMQAEYNNLFPSDDPSIATPKSPCGDESSNVYTSRRQSLNMVAEIGPLWNLCKIIPSSIAALFRLVSNPGEKESFIIGQGLTQTGAVRLGEKIANMTIGDLEALLDSSNIDPETAVQMISQLRELYFKLITGTIDVVFDGNYNTETMSSFEYQFKGAIEMDPIDVTFVYFGWSFYYFPCPCTLDLRFEASGYFGIGLNTQLYTVEMHASATLDPYIGIHVMSAADANCLLFRIALELHGYVFETHFPVTAELNFGRMPLVVLIRLDVVIHPIRFELIIKVDALKLFTWGKRKKRRIGISRISRIWNKKQSMKTFAKYKKQSKALEIIDNIASALSWHTVASKVLWSWSAKPWRFPNLFSKNMTIYAPSIEITFKTLQGRVKRSASSVKKHGCSVSQLPNRDINSPVVELWADAFDEYSLVKMTVSIGTTPGGIDILDHERFAGPVLIKNEKLANHGPIYFTVTAVNKKGYYVETSCDLSTYDIILPTGFLTTTYASTSDPSRLDLTATIFDDSRLKMFAAVGYGSGINGNNIRDWQEVNFNQIAKNAYFVDISIRNLKMTSKQFYFVNLIVQDDVNNTQILTSRPIMVDLTPPEPQKVANFQSDKIVFSKCEDLLLSKWREICISKSRFPNHRVIEDGPGSDLIFNGLQPMTDLLITKNNYFLSAVFEPFRDYETGIFGYTMCFGSQRCLCDRVEAFDPHEYSASPHEWNYKGMASPSHKHVFDDGPYFVTVTAINKAFYGNPLATTVCHYRPQVIDTSPPEIESAGSVTYDMELGLLTLRTSVKEVHSALQSISLAAGKSRHDLDVYPITLAKEFNTPIQFYTGVISGHMNISHGSKTYIHLVVRNNLGIKKVYTLPHPFLVDSTPPIAGEVFDGNGQDKGRTFFGAPKEMCVTWSGFHDLESRLSHYLVTMGSCLGCSDLHSWDFIGAERSSVCIPPSVADRLRYNVTYYSRVTAVNGGHAGLSVSLETSGMTFDNTTPTTDLIVDGRLLDMEDEMFTSDGNRYSVQWLPSSDSISGLSSYRLHTNKVNSQGIKVNLSSTRTLPATSQLYHAEGLNLRHGDVLQTTLTSINGAGLSETTTTSGEKVDLTPPEIVFLHDGDSSNETALYQQSTDSLEFIFQVLDPESGVIKIKYHAFKVIAGSRMKIGIEHELTSPGTEVKAVTIPDLNLTPGELYGVTVTVFNEAGLSTVRNSEGIIIDNSPPVIASIIIQNAEIHDNITWVSSQSSLTIHIKGYDVESDIEAYWIAVATKGSEDNYDYQRFTPANNYLITNLSLEATNSNVDPPSPLYFIAVYAENKAQIRSTDIYTSSLIGVIPGDIIGHVRDGPDDLDIDFQFDDGHVTAKFSEFFSPTNGLEDVMVGVGSDDGLDNILPFTTVGIHTFPEIEGSGVVHTEIPLMKNIKHHVTVRFLTGSGRALEATSDGFIVVQEAPVITLINLPVKNNVSYLTDIGPQTFQWEASDNFQSIVSSSAMWNNYPDYNSAFQLNPSRVPSANHNNRYSVNVASWNRTGVPHYVLLSATDKANNTRKKRFHPVVIDRTFPQINSLHCQSSLSIAREDNIKCTIAWIADLESSLMSFEAAIVKRVGLLETPIHSQDLCLNQRYFSFSVTDKIRLQLLSNDLFVRVNLTNAAGLSRTVFSNAIQINSLPPKPGIIVEIGDVISQDFSSNRTSFTNSFKSCTTENECLKMDAICQVSLTSVTAAWTSFKDDILEITRFEVCLGSFKGGCDLKDWIRVDVSTRVFTFTNVDMATYGTVFASVRGYNTAGLSATSSSNGISISYLARGQQPVRGVWDGQNSNGHTSYQSDPTSLSASWDFSAEPCPLKMLEWAVVRVNGIYVQNFTDMTGKNGGTVFNLDAKDGESFRSIVRVRTSLNLTYLFTSKGVTIKMEPIKPGYVYDGPIIGHDFEKQASINSLSANWHQFNISIEKVQLFHNPERNDDSMRNIDHYEVAIGTDRRHDITLTNVMSWTNVGQKTSATFEELKLKPFEGIYYVSVRAYSRWFSMSQATSNGIKVGFETNITNTPLIHRHFTNNTDNLDVSWNQFETNVEIQFYYIGVRLLEPGVSNMSCEEMLSIGMDTQVVSRYYNIRGPILLYPMEKTLQNTTLDRLFLVHNTTSIIEVIGGNSAGQCVISQSTVFTDLTPPIPGDVTVESQPLKQSPLFTRRPHSLLVTWTGAKDHESGIKHVFLRLLRGEKGCQKMDTSHPSVTHQMYLESGQPAEFLVAGEVTTFEMEDITIESDIPYWVQIEFVNQAGGSSQMTSHPILLEDTVSSLGSLRVGEVIEEQNLFINVDTNITYLFLHQITSENKPKARFLSFSRDDWIPIQTSGMLNMAYPWVLHRSQDMVKISGTKVDLSLQRLVSRRGVLAGAISRPAAIEKTGGLYQFQLRAAPGLYAITSFLLWDGPTDTVGDFKLGELDHNEMMCSCCLNQTTINKCTCDCSKYTTTTGSQNTIETQWKIVNWDTSPQLPQDLNPNADSVIFTSCGVNIFKNDSWILRLWCRSNTTLTKYDDVLLDNLDPSVSFHNYSFHINKDVLGSWTIRVELDSNLLIQMFTDIPTFSSDCRFTFHIWNKPEHLPPVGNQFSPYKTTASIQDFSLPINNKKPLQYAKPFQWKRAAPITYYAKLRTFGNNLSDFDIVNWTKIVRPCVPCDSACSRLFCDSSCQKENLKLLQNSFSQVNFTTYSSVATNDTRLYIHVKAVTDGGYTIESRSDPISVDFTYPVMNMEAPWSYFDVASKSAFTASKVQSSNTTIKLQFSIFDPESGILAYRWAIGSQPGFTDVMDFVDINETTVQRGGLRLKHKSTYYATIAVLNFAGLQREFMDTDGVTVLSEPPSIGNLTVTLQNTQDLPKGILASKVRTTTNATAINVEWSEPEDRSVALVEVCVGSQKDLDGNIVNCIEVPRNVSHNRKINSMVITNGNVNWNDQVVNTSDIITGVSSNKTYEDPSAEKSKPIYLEPGKHLNYHVRLCNEAIKCVEKPTDAVLIMSEESQIMTAPQSTVPFTPALKTRRKKRSVDEYSVTLTINDAEQPGVSLLYGTPQDPGNYASDGVNTYSPYIVNPALTKDKLSRLLVNRNISFIGHTFFISPVSQEVGLSYPLTVEFTLNLVPSSVDQIFMLLYWNTETKTWNSAYDTCNGAQLPSASGSKLMTNVCRTQFGASNWNKQISPQLYFKYETQFALASINKKFGNRPPKLLTKTELNIPTTEHNIVAVIQLASEDKDADPINWGIGTPSPSKGSVSIDEKTGVLVYRPLPGAVGVDYIKIVMKDNPPPPIESTESTFILTVHLETSINILDLLLARGLEVISSKELTTYRQAEISTYEQIPATKECYNPVQLDLYAFMLEPQENVTFQVDMLAVGEAPLITGNSSQVHAVPDFIANTSSLSNSVQSYHWHRVPVQVDLPLNSNYSNLTLRMSAKSSAGQFAKHLYVDIVLLDECPPTSINASSSETSTPTDNNLVYLAFILLIVPLIIGLSIVISYIYNISKNEVAASDDGIVSDLDADQSNEIVSQDPIYFQ